MTPNPNLKSHRLFGAADLLLKAIQSRKGMNSLITVHSDDSQPGAAAPTQSYTLNELIDAMGMLSRMGFLPVLPRHVIHNGVDVLAKLGMNGIVQRTPLSNGATDWSERQDSRESLEMSVKRGSI